MRPEILAIFIPIVLLVGLFTVIALNILFKYKAKELMAKRTESLDEWHKADVQIRLAKAEAQASRRQGAVLRICGLLVGIGIGVVIGCIVLVSGSFDEGSDLLAVFLMLSLAMVFGGAGLIGAWFLERRLENRKQ